MPKTIIALGLHGMNNMPQLPGKFLDDSRMHTPRIILNANPLDSGVVVRRKGYAKRIYLANCHSLWAGSVMLCIADGSLYRLEGRTKALLCEVTGARARMNYVELDNLVYLASPSWKGVYDVINGTVRSWGLPLPPMPNVSLVSGDLPPGAYSLCYTTFDGNRLGGNGSIIKVSWETGGMGIQLNNLPANAVCWITHPNGDKLFQAQVSGGQVVGSSIKPLPTLGVCPPPGMAHFIQAFGRMWGACGKKVYYNDPFQYEWFRAGNYLPFPEDPVMVAPVNEGLFISSLRGTWFAEGTDPSKMRLRRVGDGAIPGTLVMAQVEGGGYEISKKLSHLPSPVWMSRTGFVVGTNTGHLVRLTEARVKLLPRQTGAAVAWMRDGYPQIIISMSGSPAIAEQDPEIGEIRRNSGRLFNS